MEKELELIETIKSSTKELVSDAVKGLVTKEEVSAQLEAIKSSPVKDVEAIKTAINDLSAQFELMKTSTQKSATSDLQEFKQALKEAAIDLKSKGNFNGFMQVKTLAAMTLINNTEGQIPQADRETRITNVPRQMFTIRNGANTFAIASNYAEWVEQRNQEGSATVVSEGASKPMIDWEYFVSGAKVEKIAAYIKISNEMLADIDGMLGEINSELSYKVELAEEVQLITGTGVSPNINGIDKYAQSLDLAALAGTIQFANNWDAIAACITQIRVNGKGEFKPNRILMNPVDVFTSLFGIKETSRGYVNPVSVVASPVAGGLPAIYVLGVPVVQTDSIAAGTIYVYDGTKHTIRDKQAMAIEIGYEMDDFTKNMVTIRAEKRLVSYVKANHVEAFIKTTLAAAKLFIEAGS